VPVAARLIDVVAPSAPEGVVLVLHGGGNRGESVPVSPTQLSVLRMIPLARQITRPAGGRLAVLRLLNTYRGWDSAHTPVADVAWALGEVGERYGAGTPVCLVGHSLGGRAALLSAGRPEVRGVVALAPWVYPDDRAEGALAGTPIVIIHGDGDRVARPERARAVAATLARQTSVSFVTVTGGQHAMLRRRDRFDGLAARCVAWMLLGEGVERGDDPVLARIAAGEPELTL
jgi:predicted esterase